MNDYFPFEYVATDAFAEHSYPYKVKISCLNITDDDLVLFNEN